MPRVRVVATALLLCASFVITGCESPTAPQPEVQESFGLLDTLDGLLDGSSEEGTAQVLERAVPLASDEVVTRTIGRWGGVIVLPESGLSLLFPYGAVRSDTRITVTAPAGGLVGYHMEPHGLEFRRPVTVVQNMLKTKGLHLDGLSAVYFEGDLEPEVSILERLPLMILRVLGIFTIEHFSGYVIATN